MGWVSEARDQLCAAASAHPSAGWLLLLLLYLGLAVWRDEPAAGEPPSSHAARLTVLLAFAILAVRSLARLFRMFLANGGGGYLFAMIALFIATPFGLFLALSMVWEQTESLVYYGFVIPLNSLFGEMFGVELGEEIPQKTMTLMLAITFLSCVLFSVSPMFLIRKLRKLLRSEPRPVRILSTVQVRKIVPSSHSTQDAPPEPINAPGGRGRNPLVYPPAGPPAICP